MSRLCAAALATALAWSPACARDVILALREDAVAGAAREALIDVILRPLGVAPINWGGTVEALRQPAAEWSIVSLAALDGQTACDQALLEKLDWAALGSRDHFSTLGATDCTVGLFAQATVLAWDHEKLAAAPSWADFWDIAKIPGKRGLAASAAGNLEIALMADGVAPGDVYRVLRGADGVARAFRKLDQLKPYLVFWQAGADAARILGSGDVLMTSGPDTAFLAANRDEHRGFALQWAGNMTRIEVLGIPRGSPDLAAATKGLAAVGDPRLQSRLPAATGLGGLAKGANDGLPPEQQAQSPSLPANLDRGVVVDEAFWRDNRDRLAPQFDAWMAR